MQQQAEQKGDREVTLTKSEEELSSPDRRSLMQKKLAERFMNTLTTTNVDRDAEEIKSESSSSDHDEADEESKDQHLDVVIDKKIFESNGSEMSAHAVLAENFEFSMDDDDEESEM